MQARESIQTAARRFAGKGRMAGGSAAMTVERGKSNGYLA